MKKILAFVILTILCIGLTQAQQFPYGRILTDTSVIVRTGPTAGYVSGDLIRDTTTLTVGKFLSWTVAREAGYSGYIVAACLSTDTANVTGAQFTILLFSDTTGLGKYLCADNAVYQTSYWYNAKKIGEISLSQTMYGTTGGGATGASAYATGLNIPFQCANGVKKIYGLLIAGGTYTPKVSGKFRVRLWSDVN
jgi:hypothetical protein